MKKVIIIAIAIGALIMSIFTLKHLIFKPLKIENTKYFRFSYSTSTSSNGSVVYSLELNKEGKYIASYKQNEEPEEEKLTKEVSIEVVKDIETILINNNVNKWDGFHKIDKNVLDGNGFSLTYRRKDLKEINASGYMKYPKNYSDFMSVIATYYDLLFDVHIVY